MPPPSLLWRAWLWRTTLPLISGDEWLKMEMPPPSLLRMGSAVPAMLSMRALSAIRPSQLWSKAIPAPRPVSVVLARIRLLRISGAPPLRQ